LHLDEIRRKRRTSRENWSAINRGHWDEFSAHIQFYP
jgi:hypothetical protein